MTVSEWAEKFRVLVRPDPIPGPWKNSRAPYAVEPMDTVHLPDVTTVALMWASQLGKTAILLNLTGFHIHLAPCAMLLVEPTDKRAEDYSKERVAPMIRSSEPLKNLIADPRSRDSGNTLLNKSFPGGFLALVGSNSPSGLASRPIEFLMLDEVDRFEASAGTEGDILELAEARLSNFWNARTVAVSSPGNRGESTIERLIDVSDKRTYLVPCPHCGEFQVLYFSLEYRPKDLPPDRGYLRWDKTEDGRPTNIRYLCMGCAGEIRESDKPAMLARGYWQATAPFTGTAGFVLSALYSPWYSWKKLATQFLRVKDFPQKLKVFVNTRLAALWDEPGEILDITPLLNRRETYHAEVPAGVLVVTAGVDVHDDRFELEIVGWGLGEESWSIDYRVLHGDPEGQDLWDRLDAELSESLQHENGYPMKISTVCIDSGGHHTQRVYSFCKKRQTRMVFAVIGRGGSGRPIVSQPSAKRTGRERRPVKLWTVGVDQVKGIIYANLLKTESLGGYCHFPKRDAYGEAYFMQLTSEKATLKRVRGRMRRVWDVISDRRNEALDCRVYAYAALHILNPRWKDRQRRAAVRKAIAAEEKTKTQPTTPSEAPAPAPVRKPIRRGPLTRRPGSGGFPLRR